MPQNEYDADVYTEMRNLRLKERAHEKGRNIVSPLQPVLDVVEIVEEIVDDQIFSDIESIYDEMIEGDGDVEKVTEQDDDEGDRPCVTVFHKFCRRNDD